MKKIEKSENQKNFFSDPKIIENYALLQDIGVFNFIDSMDTELNIYKNLFTGILDIVNRSTINEIMDATVGQISDYFLPSLIVFLWKPLQNREEITIKCYRNYQLVELNLGVDSLSTFEPFFRKYPEPVSYKFFSSEIGQNSTIKSFDTIEPELVIPILGPSGLYGLVLLGRNILGEDYTQSELQFTKNLMSFVSKAIQNNLHYERTLRDVKTGLYNSAFFMTRLNEEIVRSKRNNSETSIIMIDVDFFKNFNDTFGHLAGDRVLETLAITIKQGVRLADVPSRFGGEEFTILLPDTDKDMAWIAAERLRTMVENMKVSWDTELPKVTISLGVFTFDKKANITAEDILKHADEALYLSKESGRNCTHTWGAGLPLKIGQIKSKE